MDPQIAQQLQQALQQLTMLVQQAAGGGGDPGMDPGMAGDDPNMDPNMAGGDPGMDPDMDPNMDPDMDKGMNLHDRLSNLEAHTGLRKAASVPITAFLDNLESQYLGQEFEGPIPARVGQLETALGIDLSKSAAITDDDAPQEIALDSLIKTAMQGAIAPLVQRMDRLEGQGDGEGIPSVGSLRKAARAGGVSVGRRRSGATTVQNDDDLTKAAQDWGLDGELDEKVTWGEALSLLYQGQKSGLLSTADDD